MSLLLLAPLAAAPDRVLEFGAVHEAIDMRTSYSTMGGGPSTSHLSPSLSPGRCAAFSASPFRF